jgi:serine/threonine-protein kinase HipA
VTDRSLRASIAAAKIGTLRELDGLWSFEYARSWLDSPVGFALSPHLPLRAEALLDGASHRPVQ